MAKPSDVSKVLKQYSILSTHDFYNFYSGGSASMYKILQELKKDEYVDNERLIFLDFTAGDNLAHKEFLKFLIELDIPTFFVLIITNQIKTLKFFKDNGITAIFDNRDTVVMPEDKKTFFNLDKTCVNPWINVEIKNSGEYSVCCEYQRPLDEKPMNVQTHSMAEFINSSQVNLIKKQMLSGEIAPGCSQCFEKEDLGYQSKRLRDNYVYREKKNLIKLDGSNEIVSLDIKLGYTCNFACRICNESSSSLWYSQKNKHIHLFKDFKSSKNLADWTKNDHSLFWQEIRALPNITYLQFTGGEPLLIKQQEQILDYYIENGKSTQIDIHYNTNGSVYPAHLFSVAKNFKTVGITFSIDDISDKFEYQRGGVWQEVEKNINICIKNKPENVTLDMFPTISIFNILSAYEIYTFGKKNGLNVVFNLLSFPTCFSITELPDNVKTSIRNQLTNIDDQEFVLSILPVLEYMESTKIYNNMDDFFEEVEKIDLLRKQDFRVTHSKIYNLIKENYHGKTI
jgi:hypothetical protein